MRQPYRIDGLACAGLLVGTLIACKGGSKQEPASTDATPGAALGSASKAPSGPAEGGWTTVKLDELLSTYEDNEVRGDAAYKGKVVRVAGLVGEVKKDVLDDIYVIVGSGKMLEIPTVQCFVAAGEEGAAAALKKGDPIAIEGRVDGLLMNVLVRDCKLNPMLKLCNRLQPEIGGVCKTAKNVPDVATIEHQTKGDQWIGFVMCLPTRERFQKGLDAFKDQTVISNERALCIGAFEAIPAKGKAGPLTDEALKAKIKTFFDAL